MEEYSKSKKKSHNNQINLQENQKFMMNINSNKNGSGIGCVILLGGALITAAAMGSAFLIGRKCRKSIKKITKKEENEKIKDESCKGLHFLLADSSTCIELQQPSSNGTDKLSDNDNDSISLFSTPCLIQDEKPKFGMSDEKMDTLNAIVSDHPQEEGKSPSFERFPDELELSETKIALLPDPDQGLDEVNQGNEKTEVLAHMHQGQATIFSNPALQVDNKRELLVHNDKGEPNELQHTGIIETANNEGGLIQEQEEQATGDQETINPDDGSLKETSTNEHEPLNSAFGQCDQAIKTIELMKAADENEDQDHIHSIYFEQQCADSETQIHQFSTKCDLQIQFSNEEECAKENDQANSCYEEGTSENSPCRPYSIIVQNFAAAAIRNASIGDECPTEACEDEDKGHAQITYFEEQCADAETKIDQIAKKCNLKMQFCDDQVCSNENDKANSCYEEATSENIHCGTYSIDAQNLAASEIKNVSIDDQHSAEMIKETSAMDPSASGEQSPEAEHSPIQLVEKQSFEQNCQGNVLEEDEEASKRLCMDIEVVEKDLEAHSKEVKNEVEESAFVYEEEEDDDDDDDDDDYDNDVNKDDDAQEVEVNILEGARNSSEQSNSNKIWAADSSKDLSLELKEKKVKEEEEGMKIKEDETFSVENCNLKSIQNDVAITSCQQSYDGKGDSAVNVTERYQMKLMYLHDVAAITRGRRVLLGALLVLIWCFVLKALKAFFLTI
ncbi:hypothetical protein K7X08_010990 [Anisodus acutangulus]|uniref:Uncharacterized protein n=1 Tax=Anisodus acutangulus TaxID=402998 RepID=A0A9Q1M0P6_9SOLA|nr:hypothetical protein K7X08_010990 [Anisodus acutangulus]